VAALSRAKYRDRFRARSPSVAAPLDVVAGINKERPLRLPDALRARLLSPSVSLARGGRPTSGGCTLINGNLTRAHGRPAAYTYDGWRRRMRNDPGV